MGLRLGGDGYSFAGDYPTKGCFAFTDGSGNFGGSSFYGNGGTMDQMKEPLSDNRYRPYNYDCVKEGNFQFLYSMYRNRT